MPGSKSSAPSRRIAASISLRIPQNARGASILAAKLSQFATLRRPRGRALQRQATESYLGPFASPLTDPSPSCGCAECMGCVVIDAGRRRACDVSAKTHGGC